MQGSDEQSSARDWGFRYIQLARWDMDCGAQPKMIEVAWIEDVELNFAALVIRDAGSGDTIEIQRSLSPTDQDRQLGHDVYCLVRGGAAHYGGIESYSLAGSMLSLSLSVDAASALDLPSSFEIDLGTTGTILARQHLGDLLR